MKIRILNYSFILIGICLFGLFIYPTLYRFDKLDQKIPVKINRLTGDTTILTLTGWKTLEASKTELDTINQSLLERQVSFEKTLKQNIIAEIENNLKTELDNYKKAQLDPNNYFTIGSTPEEVKRVMGTPTFIGGSVWRYGKSEITFSFDGKELTKVLTYDNRDNNLKIR